MSDSVIDQGLWAWIVRILLLVLGTILGFIWKSHNKRLSDIEQKHDVLHSALSTHQTAVAMGFVSKEDWRNDMREIRELLHRIDDKLDNKQDKP